MKKKLLVLACALCAVATFAQTGADFMVIPSQAGNGVNIAKYNGSAAQVAIPAVIDGKPVIEIGRGAFSGNKTITSVGIPEGVVSIGASAFMACSSLTEVIIPESVAEIGQSAFFSTALTSVTIPCGTIGDRAFALCVTLQNVTLGEKVTEIGTAAFSETGLTSVRIPSSVKTLGANAFAACRALASIKLSEGLATIGIWTFAGCEAIKGITFPSTLVSIGDDAFRGCTSLAVITIPKKSSLKTIGNSAFQDAPLDKATVTRLRSFGYRHQ